MQYLQSFYKNHKPFLLLLFSIIVLAYFINFFIDRHLYILGGEYLFTFDATTHVKNILSDLQSNIPQQLDNTNCFDCPNFYHHSRWHALFDMVFQVIGSFTGLHPFIFYITSTVIIQLMAIYLFVRVILKRFSFLPFLVAAVTFIAFPYKYQLLSGGTYDGIIHANIILVLTIAIFLFQNLRKISYKEILIYSLLMGACFSFFLNTSIIYFPLALYMTILIIFFYVKSIIVNKRKFLLFSLCFVIPVVIINLPFFLSFLTNGNTKHFQEYYSYGYLDALLAGIKISEATINIVYFYSIIFAAFFIIAPISIKKKLLMVGIYLFCASLILGKNSPIDIYNFIFHYFPFMDLLRSNYRFTFFELFILFILSYLALIKISEKKSYIVKIVYFLICILLFVVPLLHIVQHKDYFFVGELPKEYFVSQKYLNSLDGKKVYFPQSMPSIKNVVTAYTWGDEKYMSSLILYKNPFTSLVPVENLVQFEKFPLLSPKLLELYDLTNMNRSTKDIVAALSKRHISYIIFDGNYRWNETKYALNITELLRETKLEKKIGNIYILKIPDAQKSCVPSYGDFRINNCFDDKTPQKFINRTPSEFLLETRTKEYATKLPLSQNALYTRNVLDPIIHTELINNSILFSKDILQIDGNQKNVFSLEIPKGNYQLFVPLLQLHPMNGQFGDANASVLLNNTQIKSISPYAQCSGVHWYKISLSANQNKNTISLDITNKNYMIFNSEPLLVTDTQYKKLQRDAKAFTSPKENTFSVMLNDKEYTFADNCNSIELDLLPHTQLNPGEQSFQFDITIDKKLRDLALVSDVYYLNDKRTMQVYVLQDGVELSAFPVINTDGHHVLTMPQEISERVGNTFTIQVDFTEGGIQLQKLLLVGYPEN